MISLIIGKEYTGKEFNSLTKDKNFVKLTTQNEIHNGFQYKTGLNVDHIPFRPYGECCEGGLYFCDISKFISYSGMICKNIRMESIKHNEYVLHNKLYSSLFFILRLYV